MVKFKSQWSDVKLAFWAGCGVTTIVFLVIMWAGQR